MLLAIILSNTKNVRGSGFRQSLQAVVARLAYFGIDKIECCDVIDRTITT